jgi:folate-binding Fe-S cluster repair protein YgfZ
LQGCYIGQELTARTHHTGVVRKRILPIKKISETGQAIETGQTVVNETGKNVGQVRGASGQTGIGLMRVEDCSEAKSLTVKETEQKVLVLFPDWWPLKNK